MGMSESPLGEADDSTLSNTKKERFECEGCGSGFVAYPSQTEGWCTYDCYIEHRDFSGENSPTYSGGPVEVTCEYCGGVYETNPANAEETRFCSRECCNKWRSENLTGPKAPGWDGGEVTTECATCGETVTRRQNEFEKYDNHFCSQECRAKVHAERFSGPDHPNWKEDRVPDGDAFYSSRKWKETRQEALERDGHECQYCGDNSQLQVHHIIPRAQGGAPFDLENLVTLCKGCHNKWEGLYLRPDTR